jgi:ArsR family metal-binding transcriptional regulator
MYFDSYQLRLINSDCNPFSQKVNAVADLSVDISELLPYLNSVLKGLHYFEEEKVLTVKRGGRLITFRPMQIAVTKVEDEQEAKRVVDELVQILNETYENKDRIHPIDHSRPIPRPLDIFKLLPGKNCNECGEPACMAFALKLINSELELGKCPLLFEKEYEYNRQELAKLI